MFVLGLYSTVKSFTVKRWTKKIFIVSEIPSTATPYPR